MNSLLQVKLRFSNEHNESKPNGRNLRSHAETSSEKIGILIENLKSVLRFYHTSPKYINNILIDVNYTDIIAKSNRIRELLKPIGKTTNEIVVGARFSDAPEGEENHIITYYVDEATIRRTISELEQAKRFLDERLNGKATFENFNVTDKQLQYDGYELPKTRLRDVVIDCSVVDSFSVPMISTPATRESFLITFYKTELSLSSLMEKLHIDPIQYRYSAYGTDTISATRDLFAILQERIPYMISMISTDLSKITIEKIIGKDTVDSYSMPSPQNEPTIGVIDTLFDESVYFSSWVENTDYLDDVERLGIQGNHREHGTEVTSIIVDGPRLNPWLDDGCGRFRVRHFGVCVDKISPPRLVRKIKDIVDNNPDIHVWNLSLGTEDEVSRNFISFDAAVLDEIQFSRNVIFVVSGTNDSRLEKTSPLRVGSPADSLNSIVVNSVKRNGRPASYSRKGSVLSFFNKPDVSYYGGDYDEPIKAYSPSYGICDVNGTSFSAPWISRKLCYLIDIIGLPKEVAKALIIDSAAGWEFKQSTFKQQDIVGYGIVPINISHILATESGEIRFVVYGTSETFRTANYAIPVPKDDNEKYPYIARATLCYFPECSRSQGVDYTCRELSVKFGRVNSKGKIDDINDNVQDDESTHVDERQSRKEYRKWENTKFISKVVKDNRPLKSYDDRLWGLSITSKERLSSQMHKHLNFGAVITLKELSGVNRIQDFIRACQIRGYIVNEIDIQNRIDIYTTTQEEITFE